MTKEELYKKYNIKIDSLNEERMDALQQAEVEILERLDVVEDENRIQSLKDELSILEKCLEEMRFSTNATQETGFYKDGLEDVKKAGQSEDLTRINYFEEINRVSEFRKKYDFLQACVYEDYNKVLYEHENRSAILGFDDGSSFNKDEGHYVAAVLSDLIQSNKNIRKIVVRGEKIFILDNNGSVTCYSVLGIPGKRYNMERVSSEEYGEWDDIVDMVVGKGSLDVVGLTGNGILRFSKGHCVKPTTVPKMLIGHNFLGVYYLSTDNRLMYAGEHSSDEKLISEEWSDICDACIVRNESKPIVVGLKNNGTLVCDSERDISAEFSEEVKRIRRAAYIAAGLHHLAVLTYDGNVICIDDGNASFKQSIRNCESSKDIVNIQCADRAVVSVDSHGSVICNGRKSLIQLFDDVNTFRQPKPQPVDTKPKEAPIQEEKQEKVEHRDIVDSKPVQTSNKSIPRSSASQVKEKGGCLGGIVKMLVFLGLIAALFFGEISMAIAGARDKWSSTDLETAEVGDTVVFGEFSWGHIIGDRKNAYVWDVLERTDEDILLAAKYSVKYCNFGDTNHYLNTEFYKKTFSEEEKQKIIPKNDSEKVTMLTSDEVKKYFIEESVKPKCVYPFYSNNHLHNTWLYEKEPRGYWLYDGLMISDSAEIVEPENQGVRTWTRPVIRVRIN